MSTRLDVVSSQVAINPDIEFLEFPGSLDGEAYADPNKTTAKPTWGEIVAAVRELQALSEEGT